MQLCQDVCAGVCHPWGSCCSLPQSHLGSLESSASCPSAWWHQDQKIVPCREKTGGFQLLQPQSRSSWWSQGLDLCLCHCTLGASPFVLSSVICFCSWVCLCSSLPAPVSQLPEDPLSQNRINVWNLWCLRGNSSLCAEFPLLLICHIVLVGFLHPAIQIKVISSQVCLDLSADSGSGVFFVEISSVVHNWITQQCTFDLGKTQTYDHAWAELVRTHGKVPDSFKLFFFFFFLSVGRQKILNPA